MYNGVIDGVAMREELMFGKLIIVELLLLVSATNITYDKSIRSQTSK